MERDEVARPTQKQSDREERDEVARPTGKKPGRSSDRWPGRREIRPSPTWGANLPKVHKWTSAPGRPWHARVVTHSVPLRNETARQALRDALEDGPFTAHELSARAGVKEHDIEGHLEHIERTAKARGETFIVEPARCAQCPFVFEKRTRLGRPSKCPV